MARYAQRLKDQAVARLLPPESAAVDTVAHELGIGVATLERWRAEALGTPRTERTWTAMARLEAVIATAALDETARSAWCREQGLYPSDLEAWRDQAIAALATPAEARARPEETRKDRRRIQDARTRDAAQGQGLGRDRRLAGSFKKTLGDTREGAETDCAERSPNPGPEYPASAGRGRPIAARLCARGYR